MRQGSDVNFLLPDWEECPYCEGTGKDITKDAEVWSPTQNKKVVEDVVLECWRCQGVGMMSPESLAAYKEVDDARAEARSDQTGS